MESLRQFWRRTPFHDMAILAIAPRNKRLVVTLEEYVLVLPSLSDFISNVAEFPTVWLYESVTEAGARYHLTVKAESGDFSASCGDFRLIRISDMSVLVPPIDS